MFEVLELSLLKHRRVQKQEMSKILSFIKTELEKTMSIAIKTAEEFRQFENKKLAILTVKLCNRIKWIKIIVNQMKARKFYDSVDSRGAHGFEETDCRKLEALVKRGNKKMSRKVNYVDKMFTHFVREVFEQVELSNTTIIEAMEEIDKVMQDEIDRLQAEEKKLKWELFMTDLKYYAKVDASAFNW